MNTATKKGFAMAKSKNGFMKLQGIDVELESRGKGKPMLLL